MYVTTRLSIQKDNTKTIKKEHNHLYSMLNTNDY
jgi:hypothetical protein